MNTGAYLNRIDYRGSTNPSVDTLFALQRANLLSVPFENLDIHLGRPILLDEPALFNKIAQDRRGGFCYELNGIFQAVLQELGFRVAMLNSNIPEKLNGCGLAFDHPILLVEMEQRWLVDVGFGDPFRVPLQLERAGEQRGFGSTYRFFHSGDQWGLWGRTDWGEWELQYAFTLKPCSLDDFTEARAYYETSPKSHVKRKKICSRATPQGSILLTDRRLTITERAQKRQQRLSGEAEFALALREHFGIALDALSPKET